MAARLSRAERRAMELSAKAIRVRRQLQGWGAGRIAGEIVARLPAVLPLEAHRLARGWTRDDLSRAIDVSYEQDRLRAPHISSPEICGWEHGRHRPSPERQDYLCRVYRARPDQLGFGQDRTLAALSTMERKEAEPTNRREFGRYAILLGAAAAGFDWERLDSLGVPGRRVDGRLLEGLAALTEELGRLEYVTSPVALLPTLGQHLRTLNGLHAAPGVEVRLWSMRGKVAGLAGWLSYLVDNRRDAAGLYDFADRAAEAAGDGPLRAHVLTARSLLLSEVSSGRHAGTSPTILGMLDEAAAAAGPAAPLSRRSWLLERRAEERAAGGEAPAAERDLDRAEKVVAEASGDKLGRETIWLLDYRGSVALALGQPRRAVEHLETALRLIPDDRQHSDRCACLAALGAANAELAEVERACALLSQALDLAGAHGLGNRVRRVLGIRRDRLGRWAAEPAVRRLDERLRPIAPL